MPYRLSQYINAGLSGKAEAENYDIWQNFCGHVYSMLLSSQTNCCASYIPASDCTLFRYLYM